MISSLFGRTLILIPLPPPMNECLQLMSSFGRDTIRL